MSKIPAVLSIVVGGMATLVNLADAFGLNISPDQAKALSDVGALGLLIAGLWFHPSVPIGVKK